MILSNTLIKRIEYTRNKTFSKSPFLITKKMVIQVIGKDSLKQWA